VAFRDCRFLGWQDTILVNRGRQYFENCYIEGHVDFIFGGATAWFERCQIHCLRDGYITAASTPAGMAYGYVFNHCMITAADATVHTYLGRPWRAHAAVTWLNTVMGSVVRPAGWHNWDKPEREATVRYAEFGSTGPGAGAKSRVAWAHTLTTEEAAALSRERVLGGADQWHPRDGWAEVTGYYPAPAPAPENGNYRNPVLFADYSDPDAIRVGDDFWLTASSFNQVPGLPLLHSRDLVHWHLSGYALPQPEPAEAYRTVRPGAGVWAPALRWHGGKYWIFYPDPDYGIYLVTAARPEGPWSQPQLVRGGRGLIDPCPLWTEQGLFLVHAWAKSRAGINNRLNLLRLSDEGTKVAEDLGTIIDGDALPGCHTLEGPKLYERNGWFYVFAPAGGVKTGWQYVFRSQSLRGPYESRRVLAQGATEINGPHQGALVDTPSGDWWFLHFQDRDAYGRVLCLEPASWHDDWPQVGVRINAQGCGEPVVEGRRPALPAASGDAAYQVSDDFRSPELRLHWQWPALPDKSWFTLDPANGLLRLTAAPMPGKNLTDAPAVLTQKFPGESFQATVTLDASGLRPGDEAGLVLLGASYQWLGIRAGPTGLRLALVGCRGALDGQPENTLTEVPVEFPFIRLRVVVSPGAVCRFYYSPDNSAFVPIGEPFPAQAGRWIGAKFGLFCRGAGVPGHAAAFSQLLAEVRPAR